MYNSDPYCEGKGARWWFKDGQKIHYQSPYEKMDYSL